MLLLFLNLCCLLMLFYIVTWLFVIFLLTPFLVWILATVQSNVRAILTAYFQSSRFVFCCESLPVSMQYHRMVVCCLCYFSSIFSILPPIFAGPPITSFPSKLILVFLSISFLLSPFNNFFTLIGIRSSHRIFALLILIF